MPLKGYDIESRKCNLNQWLSKPRLWKGSHKVKQKIKTHFSLESPSVCGSQVLRFGNMRPVEVLVITQSISSGRMLVFVITPRAALTAIS